MMLCLRAPLCWRRDARMRRDAIAACYLPCFRRFLSLFSLFSSQSLLFISFSLFTPSPTFLHYFHGCYYYLLSLLPLFDFRHAAARRCYYFSPL